MNAILKPYRVYQKLKSIMELKIYPLLCPESQKAMLRVKKKYGKRWGHPYYYEPNGKLLNRLSVQLQMNKSEIRERILEERKYLISQ